MEVDPRQPPAGARTPEEHAWTKQHSGLILPPPRGSDLPERIQEWAARIGTVAAALAGLVVLVHLLGGVVMWLRFRKAGLPADQAVAFMAREELLTIGLRLMVLPALATGALALTLVWLRQRRSQRGRRARGSRPALVACAVLVAVLFLSLPASWASVTWVGLGLVIVYLWRGFGVVRRPRDQAPSPWRLAAVAILAAAVISLGRQVDEPVQLLQVEVALDNRAALVSGTFVSVDSSALYVGDTETHKIKGFRRADVKSIALGPPLERAPNRSLLSELFWSERWAITPLQWWCNGESYSWWEFGRLCDTQPSPLNQRRALDVRWIPVRINCPDAARTRCQGYLRFRTARTYGRALGPEASRRRVSFPRDGLNAVPFALGAGRTREFCVRTSPVERALLRAAPDDRRQPERPVRLEIVLSSDARGQSVLAGDGYQLDMPDPGADPSLIPVSDCSAALRRDLATHRGRPASGEAAGVEDGDTIIVSIGSTRQRIRLLGITAPQTNKLGTFACGQREGTDFLLRRLFSQPLDTDGDGLADRTGGEASRVRLVPDGNRDDRDMLSRMLRSVTVRGEKRTLEEELLGAGWVRLEPGRGPPLEHASEYRRAALAAQRAKRGLHEIC